MSQDTRKSESPSLLSQQFNPSSPALTANPYNFYSQARREEPVFFSPLLNTWIVTRYEDAMTVLKDHERFGVVVQQTRFNLLTPEVQALLDSYPIWKNPNISTSDPPDHTRLRTAIARAFSPKRISSLEPYIQTCANQLIDNVASRGQMDFVEDFAAPYPVLLIGDLLRIPEEDRLQIRLWETEMLSLLFAPPSPEEQLVPAQNTVLLLSYIQNMAEERSRAPQDDLISDLYRAGEAGEIPLTTAEVSSLLFILMVGGIDTTTKFLINCLFHLLEQRSDAWEALVHNRELIPLFIEEALRFDPPVLTIPRIAKEDVVIGGKEIHRGAVIQVLPGSANHDEARFRDSELFDPFGEQSRRHLAFGYGIHVCIGAPLVRLAGRIALEQLSQRLPSLHLIADQPFNYTPGLRGLSQLLVEWNI